MTDRHDPPRGVSNDKDDKEYSQPDISQNDNRTTVEDGSTTPRQPWKQNFISPPSTKFRQPLSSSSCVICATPPSRIIPISVTTTSTKKANNEYVLLQQGLVRNMNPLSNHSTTATTSTILTAPTPNPKVVSDKRFNDIDGSTSMKYYTPTKNIDTPNRSLSMAPPLSSSLSVLPLAHHTPDQQQRYKTIYFIRHGESLGQIATTQDRRHNMKLKDCGLSPLGIRQSQHQLRYFFHEIPKIELVLCSPLTRAVQTAILAFGSDIDATTPPSNRDHSDRWQAPMATINSDTVEEQNPSPTASRAPSKISIHYHLREMGSNIPENQPRTMKQVCDYLIRVGTIRNKREWDALIDTDTLHPPPPSSSSLLQLSGRNQYSQSASPSPIQTKQANHTCVNTNDTVNHSNVNAEDDNISPIHRNWPYGNNTDNVPNVLRRDYVQYILQWIAVHRKETNIAIVCHYHVIRAALSSSHSWNSKRGSSSSTKKTNATTPVKQGTTDLRPQNAQPIKCYLCTWTGHLILASDVDDV